MEDVKPEPLEMLKVIAITQAALEIRETMVSFIKAMKIDNKNKNTEKGPPLLKRFIMEAAQLSNHCIELVGEIARLNIELGKMREDLKAQKEVNALLVED